jgi:leucyl-tRNA synthetase
LLAIEQEVGSWWEAEKAFEEDAPAAGEPKREKYLATFPYPYVNGKFHLGHAFTVSKAEFCVSYQKVGSCAGTAQNTHFHT